MDKRKRRHNTLLPERLDVFLTFLRADAERRHALADILAKHDDHWLEDVGLSRDEARRILKKSLLRRIVEWAKTGER